MHTFRLLPIFMVVALLAGGCKGHRADHSTDNEQARPTNGEHLKQGKAIALRTDSFKYALKTANGLCEVFVDYPVEGPPALVGPLRDFIKTTLFDDLTANAPDDPAELVRAYCTQRQQALAHMLSQMSIKTVDERDAPEEGIDIRLVCTAPKFVTYEVYRYSYITHGAHGEYSDYGVTFRRSDGRRITSIFKKVDEGLYAHIRHGLKSYFHVSSDEQLQGIVTTDLALMPMPTFPPYLVADGVRLHYSIYDICTFDDGDPSITIPYAIALPYLTDEATALIKQEDKTD